MKMKKQTINKALKTAIATLSVLLVLVAAMCINVMAEDTPVTPEIISKNVSFDDNLHLYFAVPAEGIDVANITLNVYEDADGQNEIQTPRSPAVNKNDGTYIHNVNGVSCYIFRTIGIAPKEADKVIYVQAVNTVDGEEYKSEIVGYNIVTYLNEMLYKKGYITATSGKALTQKNLYLNTLDYCSWAQDLFLNYNDSDAENDAPLFNEYHYVYVKDGTVDGEDSGFYLNNEEATLVATNAGNKQWEITKYVDGVATVSTLALDKKLTVDASMTIKLVDDAEAVMKGTVRFDSADNLSDFSLVAMKAGAVWDNGKVKLTGDGTGSVTERFRVYPTGANSGKDTIVFEADVTIDNTIDSAKPNGIIYLSPLSVTTSGSTAVGTKISLQFTSSKNQANVYLNNGSYSGSSQVGTNLSFKIRYTYQYIAATADTAASAFCILEFLDADGNVLNSVSTTTTSAIKTPDECLTFEMCANSNFSGVIYIDNVAYYQTGNALSAE